MSKQDVITADAYQRLLAQQAAMEGKTHKPQAHPEHDLQVACVAWFRAQFPKDAPMLFAVPNGGGRRRVEAALLKAEGVLPGVSDLILLEARGPYGALCIEMKTHAKGSGQTPDQKAWQEATQKVGSLYCVVRDQPEFERIVGHYMALPLSMTPAIPEMVITYAGTIKGSEIVEILKENSLSR